MNAVSAMRIEKTVDRGASAVFAAAVGYAAYAYLAREVGNPILAGETGVAATAALLLSYRLLSAVAPPVRRKPVPIFDVREIEPVPEGPPAEEPLDLVDILTELEPDSRVVRLFDPAAMPTPGELKTRIDDHLAPDGERSAEAAKALHDALAELRRSLR
jgi:hypothetical protein